MVVVDLPARMVCVEEGCPAQEPVSIALLGTGGFAFKPTAAGKEWQVTLSGPLSALACRCPEHKKRVVELKTQIGPAGPRLVAERLNGS